MNPGTLPDGIITRFRTLSLERIGRLESVWNALLQGAEDPEAVRAMSRDLHTLKGDAKVVGFEEVHLLAHKLEELMALASQLQYRVSEDFELVVTMATQFASILIKKKSSGKSGIDLDGFLRQVDDVLRETRVLRKTRPTNPRLSLLSAEGDTDRLSLEARGRLAAAATDAFIEYLAARQAPSRARLRGVWTTLTQELTRLQATELEPLLERQRAAVTTLATELGKQVGLVIDAKDIRLEPRVAEAVDVAVLHLVRNALDHGIEPTHLRVAAGKSTRGSITIRAQDIAGTVHIAVADDGAGIALDSVRAAAIRQRLVDQARVIGERELLDVLCHPGFTTRTTVSDVSGRGVGLDAVKAGIAKVGGSLRLANRPGMGATFLLAVPAPARHLRVFQFLAPGGTVNLAVSARWTPTLEPPSAQAIDPIQTLQLANTSRQTLTGTPPPRHLAVRLRWGFLEIPLRIATEPQLATAERVCPTSDAHPFEIVLIDGVEALLIRPEHIAELPQG